ncbi:MAG: ferritin-like domain-containing protein [Steroidobacteraceae bacterium]
MAKKKPQTAPIDIGISGRDREAIAHGLAQLLADSYTLYLMTHNFHWNVTGPQFNSLHLMFMGQYTEQWNALDLIAERIRALGHPAPGHLPAVRQAGFDRGSRGCAVRQRHDSSPGRGAGSHGTNGAQAFRCRSQGE